METEEISLTRESNQHALLLTSLTEEQRTLAMERFAVVRLVVEEGLSQAQVAREHHIPLRSLQRWVALYRKQSLVGLARSTRTDRGTHRNLTTNQIHLIEGLALQKPKPSIATVYRKVITLAKAQEWEPPSYDQVYRIIKRLDKGLLRLAHEGAKAYQEAFDVVARHEAERSNALWQADHTLLDIWLLNEQGKLAKPWLSIILDDYSRCISGYLIGFQTPSALHTALTLRRAIWRKEDPRWHICGIPEQFYTDHGSDFTSVHLEQVAADLKMALQFSWPGVPRGRGKIERFFSTVNQMFLSDLPGYAAPGQPKPEATLDLAAFEGRFRAWLLSEYHVRVHGGTEQAPQERWEAGGFLPQMPLSLQHLDLLLLTVRKARRVQQDGISFQGRRYFDVTLAAYVGEDVIIRYDPSDMAEIRVYYRDAFLCRAVCAELAGETVSLKEIIRARTQQRKQVRTVLRDRTKIVKDALSPKADHQEPKELVPPPLPEPPSSPSRLKRYINE